MNSRAKPQVLISNTEIESTVKRLAVEITRDYRDKDPILLGILKGSFIFLSDLVRKLDFPLEVEFIRLSSYGSGRQSSGNVKMVQGLRLNVKDRHVVVVEDIVDTGITLTFLMEYLKKKKPASLKLCALTDKPSRRRIPLEINYKGITVPDKFIVGYGIDCDEKYRNLTDICVLEE
ncbi:MAG: hypoxanthine phosphoribosyltransferase [Chloroflexi bacterium RBG_13_52_12]|nr:MAG: hypoxanthine phosphoribosyltransferase [Chloroflexi bacterium RBG_13_52_12]